MANLRRLREKLHFVRLKPFDTSTPEGRNHERHRRIALSSGASALAKLISIVTSLISIPLTLHYLGTERYGMWLIIVSFSVFFSFADLGIGNGVLNQVASAYGRDDDEAIHKIVSSGYGILSLVAVLILTVFNFAYPYVPWYKIFNVGDVSAQAEAGPAVAAFVGCFALAIPLGVVQRVQMGLQRSFLSSLWQCGSSLMGLAGILIVIGYKGGLMWLVIAFMGAPLAVTLLNGLLFFGHMMPEIRPRLSMISTDAIRNIVRTGGLFFVLQIVGAIAFSSDGLVIAQVLGVAAVPLFAIPERLFGVIASVMQMLLAPLWPAYGEALAREDHLWARKTLKRSMVASAAMAFAGSALLILLFPFIMSLWLHKAINPPFMLILGFGIWKVIEAIGNSMAMLFNGANVVGFQIAMAVTTGVVALALKILFAHYFGVSGTIWATIIAYSFFSLMPYAFRLRSMLN